MHSIHLYQQIADRLPDDLTVYAIYVPAELELNRLIKEDRDKAFENLVMIYVNFIREHQPQGPYQLVGVSFGGCLAYTIAQKIMALGE
ncbi:MAG: thioesterase domain-containing protein [Cellvibrionaceae bacterium]